MRGDDDGHATLLNAARARGSQMMGGVPLPGLDHFTVYAGLIGSALELGKLFATAERDMAVIQRHHEISVAQISGAFAEVEQAMTADFQRDESLKAKTFDAITQLIAAGQYEIAGEFHKRLIDGFSRPSLEAILEHRNVAAGASGSRLTLR
ncbi:MAG: hypothetical protein QM647_08870 [Asticcacaulis sp.]|uniref:hypothetical protein n=1 Tax=Asticcacaulis sp. TaxID=1872648 RepID=UPI0039E2FED2